MLAVPVKYSEDEVLEELVKLGITKIISKNSERINLASELVPVLPKSFDSYNEKIDGYFFDHSKNYRLFYIDKSINKAKLKKLPFYKETILDFAANSVNVFFYLVLASYVLLIISMKEKLKYCAVLLPFLCFAFSNKLFVTLVACVFTFSSFFFIEKYDYRKHCFHAAIKNPFIAVGFAFSIIVTLINSVGLFLLYLAALVCSANIFVIYAILEKKIKLNQNKEKHFDFVRISTANLFPTFMKKNIYLFYGVCSIILVSSIFYFIPNSSKKTSEIEIPYPSKKIGEFSVSNYEKIWDRKTANQLADFSDFVNQRWAAAVYPYSSINLEDKNTGKIKRGCRVFYFDYVVTPIETNDGINYKSKIVPVKVEAAKFDGNFIKETVSCAKNTKYPTIEKMLANQNGFCNVDYSSFHSNLFEAVLNTLVSLFFSAGDILLFMVGKSKKTIKACK